MHIAASVYCPLRRNFKCHLGTPVGCVNGLALFTVRAILNILRQLTRTEDHSRERTTVMPSLFRFLFIVGALAGLFTAGMWVLATKYEPFNGKRLKSCPASRSVKSESRGSMRFHLRSRPGPPVFRDRCGTCRHGGGHSQPVAEPETSRQAAKKQSAPVPPAGDDILTPLSFQRAVGLRREPLNANHWNRSMRSRLRLPPPHRHRRLRHTETRRRSQCPGEAKCRRDGRHRPAAMVRRRLNQFRSSSQARRGPTHGHARRSRASYGR